MAERVLMNEFKALNKEPWTNIEVSSDNNKRINHKRERD